MTKITDYTMDQRNANAGTERGQYMIDHSIESYGLGRSIVVDKNGAVIAGNKTLQAAIDVGIVEVEEVITSGSKLVVVRREDLELDGDDGKARLLAYADNRAGEVGLEWDAGAILADLESGLVKGKMRLVFVEILKELKASGYKVSAKLLNAKYFHVPQSRQRL